MCYILHLKMVLQKHLQRFVLFHCASIEINHRDGFNLLRPIGLSFYICNDCDVSKAIPTIQHVGSLLLIKRKLLFISQYTVISSRLILTIY